MAERPVCVLVSGGLDSCVLAAEMSRRGGRVWPLYIRQGLAWENAELFWLKKFLGKIRRPPLQRLTILALPMGDLYGRHWSTGGAAVPGPRSKDAAVYLPGRNLALSVKAAIFAVMKKIPRVVLGSLDHNPFPDAAPRFFRVWSRALSSGLGRTVSVTAPYRSDSKVDVIRRGRKWPLHASFSCISPARGRKHCGRCNKCVERRRAFRLAGVEDRTIYADN